MKKEHRFKVDDKVFAKVKGYPAWPAIILEDLGKKYKVRFYGTGEIGQIKLEDLFYYTKNKQKLLKPSKRKDFNDSVTEIEEAIKLAGTDGSPDLGGELSETSILNDSTSVSSDTESVSLKKRKRSLSVAKSDDSTPSKAKREKLNASVSKSKSSSPIVDTKNGVSPEQSKKIDVSNDKIDEKKEEKSDKPSVEKKTVVSNDHEKNKSAENNSISEKRVEEYSDEQNYIMETELEAFIAYGDYVERHTELYSKMPVEERSDSKLQVLPFVFGEKIVGIVFHKEWPPKSFKFEYERALYDKELSQRAISLKTSFKLEFLEESPDIYHEISNETEEHLNKILEERIQALQKDVIEKIKIEHSLLSFDSEIKDCLKLEKAEPKKAIDVLNKLLALDLSDVMLKKHAHVVDMVRRLRKYIGNLESWNLTEEEEKIFNEDAEEVRKVALQLYMQFSKIVFKSSEVETFWDSFNVVSSKFREETKDLSEAEFYMLSCEPNSRKNFLNNYFFKPLPSDYSFNKEEKEEGEDTDKKIKK